MGKASTKIEKIEFDVSDDQITVCRITYKGFGDVPINAMGGVKTKTFPARKSAVDIMLEDVPGYLLWDDWGGGE